MAVATPLSSAVGRCNGSKVDMSSMVLAAEARLETRFLRLKTRVLRLETWVFKLETRYSMFGDPRHRKVNCIFMASKMRSCTATIMIINYDKLINDKNN